MKRSDHVGGRPWPMELISYSLGENEMKLATTLPQGTTNAYIRK